MNIGSLVGWGIRSLLVAFFLLGPVHDLAAQKERYPSFKVGGLAFGDLYHVVNDHLEEYDGVTGVVLRRGYLTFETDINPHWFGRARGEINQSGTFDSYTFKVQLKDLYVGRKIADHRLLVGLASTPTFDLEEQIWGLRYLAPTPLDVQGVPSRDDGISAQGPLASSAVFRYRAMIGSGLKFGNETNAGFKWMGAVTWSPSKPWTVDLYGDYQWQEGPHDIWTLKAFVGYSTESVRLGAEFANQDRQADPGIELASGYVIASVNKKISLVQRVDWLIKPSPKGNDIAYTPYDPSAPAVTFLTGVEFKLTTYTRVTPNSVITVYGTNDQGVEPATDVLARLTLYLDLE